jgi:small subunit ribosomal protein S20
MAHSLSAKKRIRQNVKRRARNRWRMKAMKSAIKTFLDKLAHGSVDDARGAYREAASTIDRTAQHGVIHRNQAARRKSRLNARLKAKALAKA